MENACHWETASGRTFHDDARDFTACVTAFFKSETKKALWHAGAFFWQLFWQVCVDFALVGFAYGVGCINSGDLVLQRLIFKSLFRLFQSRFFKSFFKSHFKIRWRLKSNNFMTIHPALQRESNTMPFNRLQPMLIASSFSAAGFTWFSRDYIGQVDFLVVVVAMTFGRLPVVFAELVYGAS